MKQQLVILSETKNLGCVAVSSMRSPDPSAAPQDDNKIASFGPKKWRNGENFKQNEFFLSMSKEIATACLIGR